MQEFFNNKINLKAFTLSDKSLYRIYINFRPGDVFCQFEKRCRKLDPFIVQT